ncbi:hypothetical protein [Hydrogenophaga sp.]|nr:hypothetical protein [Hydrogenophaga sp.]
MSQPPHEQQADPAPDVTESLVHQMHIVLPVLGALLMFLLAFIAVTVA